MITMIIILIVSCGIQLNTFAFSILKKYMLYSFLIERNNKKNILFMKQRLKISLWMHKQMEKAFYIKKKRNLKTFFFMAATPKQCSIKCLFFTHSCIYCIFSKREFSRRRKKKQEGKKSLSTSSAISGRVALPIKIKVSAWFHDRCAFSRMYFFICARFCFWKIKIHFGLVPHHSCCYSWGSRKRESLGKSIK